MSGKMFGNMLMGEEPAVKMPKKKKKAVGPKPPKVKKPVAKPIKPKKAKGY